MGSTAFRAISRPFLIGRALDGPCMPTVRPVERVRKRRASQCTAETDPKAEGACVEPLRPVVVCRVVFDAVGAQRSYPGRAP
jgi:hypothetical protein